jgi:hypothetical protein
MIPARFERWLGRKSRGLLVSGPALLLIVAGNIHAASALHCGF